MKWQQYLEHLFWTVLLASIGPLVASGVFDWDIALWQAVASGAITGALNWAALVGRVRLRTLPDPGQGLLNGRLAVDE